MTRVRLIAAPLAGALLLLAGCGGDHAADGDDSAGAAAVVSRFDPNTAEIGERVGEMTLQIVTSQRSMGQAHWYGAADFTGEIELAGRYRPHPDYPAVDMLCFYPEPAAAARLPHFPDDDRETWFCFRNQADARAALGDPPAKGRSVVVVDDYDYVFQPSDAYNTARFVRLGRTR